MAYSDQAPGSRRVATIAGVAVIHGLLGFAFVTGMASSFVRDVSRTLTTTNVPIDVPPPIDTPPPPERTATAPASASSITTVVPRVPTPAASSTVFVDLAPTPSLPLPLPPARIEVAPPPPPPTVGRASGVRAIGNRNAWITTDDYPAAALRAEEEGVVAISVQVGSDGRVTGCAVTASSGSGALDSAACRLYQRRARFEPARDDAGHAIVTSYADRVRWQLPR